MCTLRWQTLLLPPHLRDIALHSIHKAKTGEAGMMFMAQLIWFPRIYRDIKLIAQRCKACTAIGNNLKPLIPKRTYTKLNSLTEPNEELQLDFTGTITENHKDTYILVSIDRYSRYPNAEAYHHCDTEKVSSDLKSWKRFHGIPHTLRCDQAQAFKSRKFKKFLEDNNEKHTFTRRGPQRQRLSRTHDTKN